MSLSNEYRKYELLSVNWQRRPETPAISLLKEHDNYFTITPLLVYKN